MGNYFLDTNDNHTSKTTDRETDRQKYKEKVCSMTKQQLITIKRRHFCFENAKIKDVANIYKKDIFH